MRVPTIAGPQDHGTTGLRDHETTGLRDHRTAEYAEKWSTFAYFVYSAVLWPFFLGGNAQFLVTKCKKAAKTLNHGFPGWQEWGMEESLKN